MGPALGHRLAIGKGLAQRAFRPVPRIIAHHRVRHAQHIVAAIGDLLDRAQLERFLRADRAAAQDQVERIAQAFARAAFGEQARSRCVPP